MKKMNFGWNVNKRTEAMKNFRRGVWNYKIIKIQISNDRSIIIRKIQ